jgi:hypothetical protein
MVLGGAVMTRLVLHYLNTITASHPPTLASAFNFIQESNSLKINHISCRAAALHCPIYFSWTDHSWDFQWIYGVNIQGRLIGLSPQTRRILWYIISMAASLCKITQQCFVDIFIIRASFVPQIWCASSDHLDEASFDIHYVQPFKELPPTFLKYICFVFEISQREVSQETAPQPTARHHSVTY